MNQVDRNRAMPTWSRVRFPELLSVKVEAGINAAVEKAAYQKGMQRPDFLRSIILPELERAGVLPDDSKEQVLA